MRVKRRLAVLVIVTAACFAALVYSEHRGVPFWVTTPAFVLLEVAAVAVIYRIRNPRALGYFALLAVVGIGLGLLGGIGVNALDRLPLWEQLLFVFGLIAIGFEQRRRRRRSQS
jgi:hypothetical protein